MDQSILMALDIRLFGPIGVTVDGRTLGPRDFGGRKPKQILEVLLLARGDPVSKDRLADLIWARSLPANVSATIETNISVLRRRLSPDGNHGRSVVITEPDAYRIQADVIDLDLDRFSALISKARRAIPTSKWGLLEDALEIASGDVLADEPYADWAMRVRDRYRSDVVSARVEAAACALDESLPDIALAHTEAAQDLDSWSESAARMQMRALAALGRRAAAIRQADAFAARLRRDLDAEPSATFSEMVARLRRGEPLTTLPSVVQPGRPLKVLLVEDNPADARLVMEAFGEHSSTVELEHAGDGETALRMLRSTPGSQRPDLVLLDLNLPGMDGREVLEQVKSDPDLRRIPVVVLTTSDAEQDILRCYDLHANSYITKPADYEGFVGVVRSIEAYWPATAGLSER